MRLAVFGDAILIYTEDEPSYTRLARMAKLIKNFIELNKEQTAEFLASLSKPKNEKNKERILKKAEATKFNVIL